MVALLMLAAYIGGAFWFMPIMARWERAGIESGDQSDMLEVRGRYVRVYDMTEDAKAKRAGYLAFFWSLIWPVRMMMIVASSAPLRDNAQAEAAKAAELAVEEHRRVIRNYEAAQRLDFDRKLRG